MVRKFICLFFLLLGSVLIQARGIEVEPRVGVVLSTYPDLGFHLGGVASFGLSKQFAIQPGVLMNVVKTDETTQNFGVLIPVYASWRIPVKKINLRLNAGPYVEFKNVTNAGVSLEAGVEYKRFYTGVGYFQDLTLPRSVLLNLSFGYKFKVSK